MTWASPCGLVCHSADRVPTWLYQRPFASTFGAKNLRNMQLFEDGILYTDRVWIDKK